MLVLIISLVGKPMVVYCQNNPEPIQVGLFNPYCGHFEVRLKPTGNVVSNITNIQFTIKWPENTVNFKNIQSQYKLQQQGQVNNSDGFNYAVFVSVPATSGLPVELLAGEEYTIMTFVHDQSGSETETFDMLIADDQWAAENNGQHYVELLGLDATGSIYHEPTNVFAGECNFAFFEIGLFNPECGNFEVRLRPSADISSNITNIQFTIKWPEDAFCFINFHSEYQLEQQGPVYSSSDHEYAVFVSVPASDGLPIEWEAGEEHVILTFAHDQGGSETETSGIFIADDPWATENNGLYYVETLGLDATGIIYHQPTDVFGGACNFAFLKVILQGAYNHISGNMRTTINDEGNLPSNQPYNTQPWYYHGNQSMYAFPDSIVDWILVELRDPENPSILLGQRAALLTKGGNVVDHNLLPGLYFENQPGLYHLVVKHRNHIPAMTGNPILLPNSDSPYDFTEVADSQPYKHNDPLPSVLELEPEGSNKYGLITGDVNADGMLKYTGGNNDRDLILIIIEQESGSPDLTGTAEGYFNEDVNLDNTVMYIGADNDRDFIFSNLERLTGSNLINIVFVTAVPEINKD